MKKTINIFVLVLMTIVFCNSCSNPHHIRVCDISKDIIDYETKKIPTVIQQSGKRIITDKEVINISIDSLVLYGCNSASDELHEDLSYNGYLISTWDIKWIKKHNGKIEKKTIYINVSDLIIKKEKDSYYYKWYSDYNSAFNSITWIEL